MARYLFTEKYIKNKIILDAGCGCGYGTSFITKYAAKTIGIDISQEAIDYATARFKKDNNEFYKMDCYALKFPDETFDVVVAFELIEHIEHPAKFLQEVRRILKKDGLFIVSTPNKKRSLKSHNPFHIVELDETELRRELSSFFINVTLLGQKIKPEFYLRKKIHFLEQEIREINRELACMPWFLIKSLVPKTIKKTIKHGLFRFWRKSEQETCLLGTDSFPMALEEIEISDKKVQDAEYLLAACSNLSDPF